MGRSVWKTFESKWKQQAAALLFMFPILWLFCFLNFAQVCLLQVFSERRLGMVLPPPTDEASLTRWEAATGHRTQGVWERYPVLLWITNSGEPRYFSIGSPDRRPNSNSRWSGFPTCKSYGFSHLYESDLTPTYLNRAVPFRYVPSFPSVYCIGDTQPTHTTLVTCIVFFAPFPYLIALFHFVKNLGFLQERKGKGAPEKSGQRALDRLFDALGLKPRGDRYEALYCMAMKVAMTDGRLKSNEAEALNLIVKRLVADAPPGVELRALRTVQAARTSTVSFLRYAEDFAKRVDGDRVELALALEVLVLVALSDGALDKAQEQMLLDACRVFAIPESRLWSTVSKLTYDSTCEAEDAGFSNSTRSESSSEKKRTPSGAPETPNAWAYEELGCSTADSQSVIKRRYRALVKEYHPDKLRSRGVSGRVLKQGEQRFLKIQRAYEVLEG